MGKYYKPKTVMVEGRKMSIKEVRAEDRRRISVAASKGLKTYRPVFPCIHGHHEKYVSSRTCAVCGRAKALTIHESRERLYGVSFEDFQTIREAQSGRCAICCDPLKEDNKVHVDHCHTTGMVRGLLCRECNLGIGHLKDDLQNVSMAYRYLENSLARRTPAMRILYEH